MPISKSCPLMLQPFTLPNGIVLKTRLEATPSGMQFMQGPDCAPNEGVIANYVNKAKNGAAIVVIREPTAAYLPNRGGSRFWSIEEPRCQHPIAQLTELIHGFGSKALARFDIDRFIDKNLDVSDGIAGGSFFGSGLTPRSDRTEAPAEHLHKALEQYLDAVESLKKDMGFDGVWLHMAYRQNFLGRCFSPLTNRRQDSYGGSLENRCRWPLEVARRIKERCGAGFIVEGSISGHDPIEGGTTLDEVCRFAHMAEGIFDILQIRGPQIDESHPIQFHSETPWLYMAEKIKAASPKVAILSVGGFFKPETVEAALASGKADMIGMARAWISNFDYGRLVREGRNEDLTPCLRCNKCHRTNNADPWTNVCSVNPLFGLEHRLSWLDTPTSPKKVAVIGGGPAGMKAALEAVDRGHHVTLYEKSGHLGGQLDITKDVPFKWTLQDFKNYLIRQIEQSPVTVKLNCAPAPEELARGHYDAVFAALGAEPLIPPIAGVMSENVLTAEDAYANAAALPEDLVIIGGGEIGIETGMYLAGLGRKVTVLEMRSIPAPDATPLHYYKMFKDEWEAVEGLTILTSAKVTEITAAGVNYTDAEGARHFLPAKAVILAAGMKAKLSEALTYAGVCNSFALIGDCEKVANVQKALRRAWLAVSTL